MVGGILGGGGSLCKVGLEGGCGAGGGRGGDYGSHTAADNGWGVADRVWTSP